MTPSPISRRGFLIVGLSTALLAGCTAVPGPKPTPNAIPPSPSPSPSPTPTPSRPPAPSSVAELLARPRFYVGHRGSGDNWPEHTLTAYRNASLAGADAIEISVCSTSDGVLVCHHDLSAERVLGVDKKIGDMTWSEVSALEVDARSWLGVNTPLEPVSRLEDVLRELGPEVLVFIEDKQGTNTMPILDILDAQARPTDRFVWKQWAPAAQVRAAKERGYRAWGYFDDEQLDRLDEFAATFDILGVPTSASDEMIRKVVGTGLPVMCWEVRFHDQVQRLAGLGVRGMMCSNIAYLVDGRPADRDAFATGRRAAGDLPSAIDTLGWSSQPVLVPSRQSLRIQGASATSYLMGSLAAPDKRIRRLDATIVWPDAVPPKGSAGVVFALSGDAPGGQGERGDATGCQLTFDVDGTIEIAPYERGVTGSPVSTGKVEVPTAGSAVRVRIDLDDDHVRVTVADRTALEAVLAGAALRGTWVRLFKDYKTDQAVEFSGLRVVSG
ncbi:glycerophosphodiester phosphodiesterase [Microbacterium sp. LWH7-1.2]|jgi:glycerophosphoryl diester phosphodiesterase|uniref:glycerophosphodiester phosphodiesterase n=1 Tax=Microbacterium sp. LWH7-1.2 TaxID=3135257 RepID=UPI003139C934